MRFAGSTFGSAHALDLLGDVLPIHLIVDELAGGHTAQRPIAA
jgi:hypothetical protein